MTNLIERMKTEPVFSFTSDIDWASEPAIAANQALFDTFSVVPTYFITHPSQTLDDAVEDGRARAGLHPNFLAGSSHGEGFSNVADYFEQFPASYRRCYRSHRFFDVTDISVMFRERGHLYDSNHFSFMYKIPPYRHFSGTVRLPVFWEDGTHLRHSGKLTIDDVFAQHLLQPGLTIISMHPMHIAMNSPTLDYARQVKDRVSREEWNAMDPNTLASLRNPNRGVKDLVHDILAFAKEQKAPIATLENIYTDYIAYAAEHPEPFQISEPPNPNDC